MKKLIYTLLIILSAAASHAELVLKKTDTGISYYESLPTKPGIYPIVQYWQGYKQDILSTPFVKEFVPENAERAIILIPILPCANGCGWEFPYQGVYVGTHFTRWAKTHYIFDSRTYITGHSAGGDYDAVAQLGTEITAFVACAGSGENYNKVLGLAGKGIPVRHYHGTLDGAPGFTSANNYNLGYKTAVTWFQQTGKGNMEFIAIDGGNHNSAPARAYSKAEKLMDWFLKWGIAEGPPPAPRDTLAYIILENGVWLRVMKSGQIYKEN